MSESWRDPEFLVGGGGGCGKSRYKKGRGLGLSLRPDAGGGYLLFRFRSTIGVAGFNFSVRNGKRWSPRAIAT